MVTVWACEGKLLQAMNSTPAGYGGYQTATERTETDKDDVSALVETSRQAKSGAANAMPPHALRQPRSSLPISSFAAPPRAMLCTLPGRSVRNLNTRAAPRGMWSSLGWLTSRPNRTRHLWMMPGFSRFAGVSSPAQPRADCYFSTGRPRIWRVSLSWHFARWCAHHWALHRKSGPGSA
jgi:hypothetical protein